MNAHPASAPASLLPPPLVASRRRLVVTGHDDAKLEATLFYPARPASDLVLVFPAMGVTATFYTAFAEACCERGHAAVLMDPRGVGTNAALASASITDWVLDLERLIEQSCQTYRRVHFVGHSMGGQLFGLLRTEAKLARVVFVSSSAGTWWRYKRPSTTVLAGFLMVGFIPLSARLLGRVPVSKLGLGYDLPAGVASEWARWCRRPNYISDERAQYPTYRHDQLNREVLSVRVSDDDVATAPATAALTRLYPKVRFVEHVVHADRPIGHIGFFRRVNASHWGPVFDYLEEGQACAELAEVSS